MKPFNVVTAPLTTNTCALIEANAGTGKTHNIQHLYLRLLLEKHIEPSKILVVTFTEAATAELKERIRSNIRAAITLLETGEWSDATLRTIIKSLTADHLQQQLYLNQLRLALTAFDEAAIFTIHSFCKRTLERNAFESRVKFDAELQPSFDEMIRECVRDFYRRELETQGKPCLSLAALMEYATIFLNHVGELHVVPSTSLDVEQLWQDLWVCIDQTPVPSRASKFSQYLVQLKAMSVLEREANRQDIVSNKELVGSTATRNAPALSSIIAQINAASSVNLIHLLYEYLQDPQYGFEARKARQQMLSYDDLLKNMLAALPKPECALAKELRQTYTAALVDEFQDTDPVQYQIFATVFKHPESILYMIGDPKQAIYGFRGGDIYAYLAARSGITDQFTLTKNFRSASKLLEAVNCLFSIRTSFVEKELQYQPSESGREPARVLITDNPPLHQPFKLHWFEGEDEKGSAKSNLHQHIARYCCDQIFALLTNQNICFVTQKNKQKEQVKPGDIAVLVNTNQEARTMKAALLRYNIPSIVYQADNVFNSLDARDIQLLLIAMHTPSNVRGIKSALVTPWCGYTTDQVLKLMQEPDSLSNMVEKFNHLYQIWQQDGIMQALNQLQHYFDSAGNIGKMPECERRMTNFRHLAELLHQQEQLAAATPTPLLLWLEQQIAEPEVANQALEERLESDRRAVTIMTIHKSKGLQFPIVFVPYMFMRSANIMPGQNKSWKVHQDKKDNIQGFNPKKVVLPLSKLEAEKYSSDRMRENLSESLRLLYVAITRAENACHLFMGNLKGASSANPVNYLYQKLLNPTLTPAEFLEEKPVAGNNPVLPDEFKNYIELHLESYTQLITRTINQYYHADMDAPTLVPPPIPMAVQPAWEVMSYSSLTKHGATLPTYLHDGSGSDEVDISETEEDSDILPGGIAVGLCLHSVFEELTDFTYTDTPQHNTRMWELAAKHGVRYGLYKKNELHDLSSMAAQQCSRIIAIITNTLTQTLPDAPFGFQLGEIKNNAFKQEWSFFLHMATPIQLEHFQKLGLSFKNEYQKISGFLTGSIDLLFRREERYYFLDWKSDKLASYQHNYLDSIMRSRNYLFQAIVYSIALYLLLKKNLGNQYNHAKHFGGGYYCFIRGMQDQNGVYHLTPTETQLHEWCNQLGILATSKL